MKMRHAHASEIVKMRHALRLIEDDAIEWHDFCAELGLIPDNVEALRDIVSLFAEWLEEN